MCRTGCHWGDCISEVLLDFEIGSFMKSRLTVNSPACLHLQSGADMVLAALVAMSSQKSEGQYFCIFLNQVTFKSTTVTHKG